MEHDEIELISSGDKLQEVAQVLQDFIKNNESTFLFPNLAESNKRVILWAALFQHLQNKTSAPIHTLCLAAIRVLSRDKSELENLICEKWITTLIEHGGLYNFIGINEENMAPLELPQKDTAIEALKCLCNIAYNSEVARALCAHTSIAQSLVARLRIYKDIPFKDEIMLFDIKLLFILTALRSDIKSKIRDELHGLDYLVCCLNELLREASSSTEGAMDQDQHIFFTDNQQAIACEILKAMFNLIVRPGSEDSETEADEAMYLKLMPVLTSLLYTKTTDEEKLMELRSNVANLLTSVPPPYYAYLTPDLNPGEIAECTFEGRNMDALQSLVQLLQYRLSNTTNTKNQCENLSPILTVMNKAVRTRVARKWLRARVLPPLRDVSRPPERGSELRNQLCRLLTTPVGAIRDLVAEFIFIMCKEKVGRMVKYTGFGNAAGHLAQKGLLGARGASGRYSSSSDDSDTEEYRAAAPAIDPVVGCTRPPRPNPFEGMTDEQKEYEAMKLVNLFDKMVSEGVVVPARVGADGRPEPVQHVLELRDPPNRPQS
ncbi:synembryn-A [Cydia amplana]|uniref:synembryn-A n=1 Tax=Cydia amplana TaxID=1869771 RepID=UPI002FE5267B